MTGKPSFYGVESHVIEAAIAKARRERSEAVWQMLQKIFGRSDTEADAHELPANAAAARK